MTAYEQMVKFEIGLDMGLLTLDELRDFLSSALREKEVPYIYTDVFLSLDKGQEEITNVMGQCVAFLHRLTDYADGDWNLLSIDEYYKLNRSGYCSDEDFEARLGNIFANAI